MHLYASPLTSLGLGNYNTAFHFLHQRDHLTFDSVNMASISRKQEGTPVGLVTELELDELTLTASLAHLQQLHIAV